MKTNNSHPGHTSKVTTTNIYHLKKRFLEHVREKHNDKVADAAETTIKSSVTCYAAKLHLNKSSNILDHEGTREPPRKTNPGYAPVFENITHFPGRADKAAKLPDLLGRNHPDTPWKDRLPRKIFVSDMGDALSRAKDFPFLKADLIPAIQSEDGKRHLWLWLTKRPGLMAKFTDEIGGLPPNVCAMTTLTGADKTSLKRLSDLKKVKAAIKGLSIEPLRERIPPEQLDLEGIDWVILGGESGAKDTARPFDLSWVDEIRQHCADNGVAFFLKQLGRNPVRDGEVIQLKDSHGGGWDEWETLLRTREFPKAFHDYRKDEMIESSKPRPSKSKQSDKLPVTTTVTPAVKKEFRRQHKIVVKGVRAFWDVGQALSVIKSNKLWKAGGYKGWNDYCSKEVGLSRSHTHRLLKATDFMENLKTSPRGDILPETEIQVRPLLALPDFNEQVEAWGQAVDQAKGAQPSGPDVHKVVYDKLQPEAATEKSKSRSHRRAEIVSRLREVAARGQSWDEVRALLADLEHLL